jgi:RNA polymerase sigma factor (TIGR02999 family)
MNDVTQVLCAIERGDAQASAALLPLVYDELRRLAAQRLTRETPGQTLDATGLVHEAYLRLVQGDSSQRWNSLGHFFGAAAEAMRRILVERVRHKRSVMAGGEFHRQELTDEAAAAEDELLEIHELLDKLEQLDARKATLVKLRFFAGMTIAESAAALGISTTTAENDWAYARCWLRLELEGLAQS